MNSVEPSPAHPPDHYAALGLDRNCTAAQIRDAYRLLAKQHHPDLNGGCLHAASRTRELNHAYEILGHPEKRHAYDRQLAATQTTQSHHASARPDIVREIYLHSTELLHGTKLDIRINDPANRDGIEMHSLVIPPMTAPGSRFRLALNTGGFVRVKVRVQPDLRFKPRGSDLRCDLRIRAQRVAQGGIESLRGATGNTLRVTIPRGVERGDILKIPEEGLPKPRGGRGDLLVRILYAPEIRITRAK